MSIISCPNCSAPVPAGATYCDNCGIPLAAAVAGLCPNCHAAVRPDDFFCDNCGYALHDQPPPDAATMVITDADVAAESETPAAPAPRLQVLPGGNILDLDPEQDAYVIGRVDPASGSFPDVDLVPYGGEEGGVSRRHAQITRAGEGYFIEDLNSVNYTFVNKNKIAVGTAHALRDGDEIRLGRVLLRFETG